MFSVGLTGGIGSGKSQVADLLAGWGAAIIDADQISHGLTATAGAAIAPLRRAFGAAAIAADGSLARAWMRDRVFADPAARRQLEAILHPLIEQETRARLARADGPYCVLVIPLLVESGRWLGQLDRVCVVDCDPDTQVRRVQARSGLTRGTIERIMGAQASRMQRLAAADDVIVNDGSTNLDTLRVRTRGLHDFWCGCAARRSLGHTARE